MNGGEAFADQVAPRARFNAHGKDIAQPEKLFHEAGCRRLAAAATPAGRGRRYGGGRGSISPIGRGTASCA
jgi:hypothetical protein